MGQPSISIIIPTFNSARSLDQCLESIRAQDYPPDKIEIIIVDAGSTDGTLEIAAKYGVDKTLSNPLKTGEAGKAVGLKEVSGEIVGFIDSDNILDGEDWLTTMARPLEDPGIFMSECYAFSYRPEDPIVDRYCALMGMNDPIHLFIGNHDRLCALNGKWTGLPVESVDRGEYYDVVLRKDAVPTMGANGSLIRRSALEEAEIGDYHFDIDVIYQLVCKGHTRVAMVKRGIIHLFCPNLRTYARKQRRRIKDFLHYNRLGLRDYPHQKYFWGYVSFTVCCLLVFPLIMQSMLGYVRKQDRAWFIHPIICWLTLTAYGWATVRSFFATAIYDRKDWSQ